MLEPGTRNLEPETLYHVQGKSERAGSGTLTPPNLRQIWLQMDPELSFWTLETSSWGFKTLRIFLDRSRPPQLNFLMTKNYNNKKKRENVQNLFFWTHLGAKFVPNWVGQGSGASSFTFGPRALTLSF